MEEYLTKFSSVLRYVAYIQDEKDKVQHFPCCLHIFMIEIIEFDNPKTMDESI